MGLKEDLQSELGQIFQNSWEEIRAYSVPEPKDLKLNNYAKCIDDAVVLYADIDGSTDLVKTASWQFSAKIYKAYLLSAARIIKSQGGEITAYDGDRIMAIFIGYNKYENAVKAAMMINYVVREEIIAAIRRNLGLYTYVLSHTIGIDSSDLYAVRTGVRGDNDIAWIGNAANYAAKLTSNKGADIWITDTIFQNLGYDLRYISCNWKLDNMLFQGNRAYSTSSQLRF